MSWVDGYEPSEEEQQAALDEIYGQFKGVRPNPQERVRRQKLSHKRKGKKGRTSPVVDYVRSLGNYFTTGEVAEQVGKSEQWVRKAAKKRWTQAPSYVAPFGDTHVNLYTPEDVEALKEYIDTHHKVFKREDFQHPDKEG